jgi:hypothetical protein
MPENLRVMDRNVNHPPRRQRMTPVRVPPINSIFCAPGFRKFFRRSSVPAYPMTPPPRINAEENMLLSFILCRMFIAASLL